MVAVNELMVGNKIRMEYGDNGNFVTVTIVNIRVDKWVGLVFGVMYEDGRSVEFCAGRTKAFEMVA